MTNLNSSSLSLVSFNFSAKLSVTYVLCDPESSRILTCSLTELLGLCISALAVCIRTISPDDTKTFSSANASISAVPSVSLAKWAVDTLDVYFLGHRLLWCLFTSPQCTHALPRLQSLGNSCPLG